MPKLNGGNKAIILFIPQFCGIGIWEGLGWAVLTWGSRAVAWGVGWDCSHLKGQLRLVTHAGLLTELWFMSAVVWELSWCYWSEHMNENFHYGNLKRVRRILYMASGFPQNDHPKSGEWEPHGLLDIASLPTYFIHQSNWKPTQSQGEGNRSHLSMKGVSKNLRAIF